MKKAIKVIILIILLNIILLPNVYAQRGCCSHHDGVSGCSNGRQVCNDGTLSPTCTCSSYNETTVQRTTTVRIVYGCTDSTAMNYSYSANASDGSCKYEVTEEKIYKTKYKTIKKNKKTKLKKQIKVLRKGKKGKIKYTYKIIKDESGTELSKDTINKEIICKPVNKIIKYVKKK